MICFLFRSLLSFQELYRLLKTDSGNSLDDLIENDSEEDKLN